MMLLTILVKAKLIAFFFACAIAVGWFIYKKQKSPNMEQTLHEPKVLFSANGREGEVSYESKEGSFKMYWEMGGNDVLAIISVPTEERWEAATKISLASRESILHFIGKKAVEQQTTSGNGTYEIQENCIIIKS